MRVRLGELTFDADTRQLLRGGAPIHLSPKAFDLLRILIDSRPRVLPKHELHDRLWPATYVSDVNLASLIAEIRDALGDDARDPRFVRTAHRVGYAFCGEAVEDSDSRALQPESFCWLVRDGHRLPLQPGENLLGREDTAIQIESPTVSRRHARIVVAGTEATIEDLESKNGTFVDGQPVQAPTRLKDGDEIRTGSVVFRFRMTRAGGATVTWSGSEGVER